MSVGEKFFLIVGFALPLALTLWAVSLVLVASVFREIFCGLEDE